MSITDYEQALYSDVSSEKEQYVSILQIKSITTYDIIPFPLHLAYCLNQYKDDVAHLPMHHHAVEAKFITD